jgi:RNA polymerase sigma-70 factor, ECF subfamily
MKTKYAEAELVELARQNPAEFAELYRQYLDGVYFYLFSKVGGVQEAEDLTAQVFLQALESLPRFRPGSNFGAWLFTIARRRAADYHRHRRGEQPLPKEMDLECCTDDSLSQILEQEALSSLAEQVAKLSEGERELLRLRFAAGLPFSEIAALLRRKESSVKMALYRLLDRLERNLGEEDHD